MKQILLVNLCFLLVFSLSIKADQDLSSIPEDFLKFYLNTSQQEFGLRVGIPIIKHAIESQPQIWQKNTRYTKIDAKDFKFVGLNPSAKEVKIGFTYRVRKYEKNPFGGTYQTYNQSWEIEVTNKYYVQDKQVKVQTAVTRAESDWAGGILGWLNNIFDVLEMTIGFIVTGKKVAKFSDALVFLVGNLGVALNQDKINQAFNELNTLNDNNVLYLVDVRFDDKGIWHIFKYDASNYERVLDFLKRHRIVTSEQGSGYCWLTAKCSGKRLDVYCMNKEENGRIGQAFPNDHPSQKWRIECVPDEPGYFWLTAECSGKRLAVYLASTENNADICQASPNSGDAQKWKIEGVPGESGYIWLTAKCSGKRLDVYCMNNDNNGRIGQAFPNDHPSQKWKIEQAK